MSQEELLRQIEEWNQAGQYWKIIHVVDALPPEERGYQLTCQQARACNNLVAVKGEERSLLERPPPCWSRFGRRERRTPSGTSAWDTPTTIWAGWKRPPSASGRRCGWTRRTRTPGISLGSFGEKATL